MLKLSMKKPKLYLSLYLIIICTEISDACQCERLYFCEYLKDPDKKVVFEATVDNVKEYSPNNRAVYLRINKIYRNDVGMPDYIKIYGGNGAGECKLFIGQNIKPGVRLFIAMGLEYNGEPLGFGIDNPEALSEEIWEFAPFHCFTVILPVDNNIIFGPVAPEIYEYPLNVFESKLENCDYSLEEMYQARCNGGDFIVYPNPSEDGIITIGNNYNYSSISNVKIYSSDGRLMFSKDFIA